MRVKEIWEKAEKGERIHLPWKEKEETIECWNTDGELLAVYSTMTEAAEDLELSVAAVSMCISGKRSHIGDYVFKRALQ